MCRKGQQVGKRVVERVKGQHLERLARTDAEHVNLFADSMIVEPTERFYQGHHFIEVERPSVLVFEDREPLQNWGHPCRFHFHDPETGEFFRTVDAQFPPDMVAPRPSLEAFHNPVVPEDFPVSPVEMLETPEFGEMLGNSRGSRYAVLLAGYSDPRHINTMEWYWRFLVDRYGFSEENILVCNYDGNLRCRTRPEVLKTWPGDETPYRIRIAQPGTVAGYNAVLDEIGRRLKADDLLFVMMQNHGGHHGESYLCATGAGAFRASDWGNRLAALPSCDTLLTVFQQCHGGGFVDPTVRYARANHTFACAACAEHASSYGGEVWSGFSLHWAAAMGGRYPTGESLRRAVPATSSAFDAYEYARKTTYEGDSPCFAESPSGCGTGITFRHAAEESPIPVIREATGPVRFPDRVRLGMDRDEKPVDWRPGALPNAHMIVAGGSGQGKTQGVKTWIERRLAMADGAGIHIFDLHGEYLDLANLVSANSPGDSVVRVDATNAGLPFRLLERFDDLPDDIRLENIMADLRAAATQLGNIQAERVRPVLAKGLHEGWDNLELRAAFEALDDPNIKAHFNPIMLLLRSESSLLKKLLDLRLVLHDLTDYQDPRSRAAYVLCFLSRVIQHRLRAFQKKSGERHRPLVIVFEEAKLLEKAQMQMQRFFQESRKLACGGVFISQSFKAVPSFVRQNSATHLLFQTAAEEDSSLRGVDSPINAGEAVVRMGTECGLVRLNQFHETFPAAGSDALRVLTVERELCADRPSLRPTESQRRTPGPFQNLRRWFVSPRLKEASLERLVATGTCAGPLSKAWVRCYCFNMSDGSHLIWDKATQMPLSSLKPVSFLSAWPAVIEELTSVLELRQGDLNPSRCVSLLRKGIAVGDGESVALSPVLHRIPRIEIASLGLKAPAEWPEIEPGELQPTEMQDVRATAAALWDLEVVEEPIEMLLPVFRSRGKGTPSMAYPAWRKCGFLGFGTQLPEAVEAWG